MMHPIEKQVDRAMAHRICDTEAASALIAQRRHDDADKALVMNYLSQLVRSGFADWRDLGEGKIELRYRSGEIFLLAEREIIRIG